MLREERTNYIKSKLAPIKEQREISKSKKTMNEVSYNEIECYEKKDSQSI